MTHFNEFYYSFSPIIADYERENPVFKEMVKIAITPMISSRSETYQNIEYCLTISNTEKLDQNYSEMQKDNQELRGILDSLSRQLQNLENRV